MSIVMKYRPTLSSSPNALPPCLLFKDQKSEVYARLALRQPANRSLSGDTRRALGAAQILFKSPTLPEHAMPASAAPAPASVALLDRALTCPVCAGANAAGANARTAEAQAAASITASGTNARIAGAPASASITARAATARTAVGRQHLPA